jgi:hypothetical protein
MALSLSTLFFQVSSLLNVQGWKTFQDGVTTSSSATFTSALATFAATDVGRQIVILGAGASGASLKTTISAYTSATQVTLAATASVTLAGATFSFADTFGQSFNVFDIDEAILEADVEICNAILSTPGHPRISTFTATSATGISSGTELVTHVGDIFNVRRVRTDASTVKALRTAFNDISRWSANDSSLYLTTANLKGEVLRGAGGDGLLRRAVGRSLTNIEHLLKRIFPKRRTNAAALVVTGAQASLFAKEAAHAEAATLKRKEFDAGLAGIHSMGRQEVAA